MLFLVHFIGMNWRFLYFDGNKNLAQAKTHFGKIFISSEAASKSHFITLHCIAPMMMQTTFVCKLKYRQILLHHLLQNLLRASFQNLQKENLKFFAKLVVLQQMKAGIVKEGRFFNKKESQSSNRSWCKRCKNKCLSWTQEGLEQ